MEFPLPHEPAHVAAAHSKRAVEDIVHELAVAAGADDPRSARQGTLPDHGRRLRHAPRHRRQTDRRNRPQARGPRHRRAVPGITNTPVLAIPESSPGVLDPTGEIIVIARSSANTLTLPASFQRHVASDSVLR